MNIYEYGQTEIDYLKKKDKKLANSIDKLGILEREVNTDLFSALIESIVSQQISSKAAETVCNRLREALGGITPQSIQNSGIETIQKCGMSMRKVQY